MSSCCDPVTTQAVNATFATLFTTGFLMSAGHCVGMCGPIVASYHGALARDCPRAGAMTRSLAIYNAGRIASYAGIGALVGLVGSIPFHLAGGGLLQGTLSITTGLLVLMTGLSLLGVLPATLRLDNAPGARRVVRRVLGLAGSGGPFRGLILGVANGFLPCGPVLAAALAAGSLGSPARSAIGMLAYGLGTLPVLLGLGLGASFASRSLRIRMVRAGAVLVLLTGTQLLARGAASLGALPHLHAGQLVIW
jgi:uncharacterized protein